MFSDRTPSIIAEAGIKDFGLISYIDSWVALEGSVVCRNKSTISGVHNLYPLEYQSSVEKQIHQTEHISFQVKQFYIWMISFFIIRFWRSNAESIL